MSRRARLLRPITAPDRMARSTAKRRRVMRRGGVRHRTYLDYRVSAVELLRIWRRPGGD